MTSTAASTGGAIPAWKLRMMQRQQDVSSQATHTAAVISTSTSTTASSNGNGIPRNSMNSKSSSHDDAYMKLKKKMEAATLDPNLPPAFKVVMKGRLAFARQQERRKNNDTWVSLNSSHVNKESLRPVDYIHAKDDGGDDDSSFASMGEDSYEEEVIQEGDEYEE